MCADECTGVLFYGCEEGEKGNEVVDDEYDDIGSIGRVIQSPRLVPTVRNVSSLQECVCLF